jgi:putative ABC transport system permease protein
MGREFVPDETQRNGAPAVILSDSLWRRSFGADPSIVGRTVTLDGAPFAIVGVLPADFWFPQRADALVPLRPTGGQRPRDQYAGAGRPDGGAAI